MPKTVSSPGPKSHGFCGQRGFQEAQGYHPMILQRIEYYDAKSRVHHVFKGKYADASA